MGEVTGQRTACELRIDDGTAYAWFAYDLGQQIDLDRAQQQFAATAARERIRHERRAPAYLQFHPAPLRLDEQAPAIAVGPFATDLHVESTLYDFGAVSIAYRIPLAGRRLDELLELASALDDHPQLTTDSERRARALIDRLGAAVRKPELANLVEDYTVFHVRRWSPAGDPEQLVEANRALIAGILRSERAPMRAAEVADALQFRIAYGLTDDLVIDWNGAFLFETLGEDTLAVLEFSNVELLEMRFLDDRLDEALDGSQALLHPGGRPQPWHWRRRAARASMRRIATLQLDGVLLFEDVNNTIKLLGDQFLARVYRLAARRFHLDEWDASILRKLQTLESIYQKLADEQSTRRMELLEWIIIALILLSILLPFVTGAAH